MKRFAVFDIDGTLIRWQLYHAVVNELAKSGAISPSQASMIKEMRMRWKSRESEDAFHEYENYLVSVFEESLSRMNIKTVDNVINRVADIYKSQVYVYTRNLIQKLKSDGYYIIAISGSHEEIVSHIAKNYGFDIWVGSKFERKGDNFTGKNFIASKNKKQILERIVKENRFSYEDSYAVGDTASDAPMLEMVNNPIAFNPNRELLEIAKSRGWKIVIERKNVCYELTQQSNGEYKLEA